MSYNGSGVFNLIAGNPVVTGTVISSTWANNTLADIANNGLTNCLTKDGQQTPTANIPLGGFRLTGVADAVNPQDVVNARQAQNGSLVTLSAVSGTDTITGTTTPGVTAYASGEQFQFLPAGSNTTNAVTLNINSLGAKSVLKPTQAGLIALAPGDIQSAAMQTVLYDGTQFQLQTPGALNSGRLLAIQTFAASGTYTPTPGTNRVLVYAIGGGGGGGGSNGQGATTVSMAGGGASGAMCVGLYANTTTQTVTVGAAGTAGPAGSSAGGAGGTSSFGSLCSAAGGGGGGAGPVSGPAPVAFGTSGGAKAAQPTLGNILNIAGAAGGAGLAVNTGSGVGGAGANGPFGGGGGAAPGLNSNGQAGTSPGAGGSGGATAASGGNQSGGAGVAGVVIVYEYA